MSDLQAGKFDVAMSGITIRSDRSIGGQFTVPTTKSGAVVLVPERTKVIRVLLSELSRLCDHLTCLGAGAMPSKLN